jgi:hypothetical protein
VPPRVAVDEHEPAAVVHPTGMVFLQPPQVCSLRAFQVPIRTTTTLPLRCALTRKNQWYRAAASDRPPMSRKSSVVHAVVAC